MRVAVEAGLSEVRQAVQARGWEVVPVEGVGASQVDAIVCTGMDDDILGDETVRDAVPVIRADGLTAEEVLRRLERAPGRGRA